MACKHPIISRIINDHNGMDYFENVWMKWVEAKQWRFYPHAINYLAEAYEEEFNRVLKDVMVTNCMRCRRLLSQNDGMFSLIII